MKAFLTVAGLAALIAVAAYFVYAPAPTPVDAIDAGARDPRPAFELADMDGRMRAISEWDGKVVAVNFWATWCTPCRKEIPEFIELQREFGGQGLPSLLSFAVDEMWNSSNMSFALCPMLGQAAVEALEDHGSEVLQQTYLAKLVSGEWCGTMDLTEPQAGSDLAAIRTRAKPDGDHYLILSLIHI